MSKVKVPVDSVSGEVFLVHSRLSSCCVFTWPNGQSMYWRSSHDLISAKGPRFLIPLQWGLGFTIWSSHPGAFFFITGEVLSGLSSVPTVSTRRGSSMWRFRPVTGARGVRTHHWPHRSVCFLYRHHHVCHWAVRALQALPRQGPGLLSQRRRVLRDRNPDWIPQTLSVSHCGPWPEGRPSERPDGGRGGAAPWIYNGEAKRLVSFVFEEDKAEWK